MPTHVGEDFKYASKHEDLEAKSGDEDDSIFGSKGGKEGPSTTGKMPSWVLEQNIQVGEIKKKIIAQYMKTVAEPPTGVSTRKLAIFMYQDNLKLHKLRYLHHQYELKEIQGKIQEVRNDQKTNIDTRLPGVTM